MSAFLTVALIHLLAVMSPGPDFAMVTRNALSFSRRNGVLTALGIAMGNSVHVAYSLLGIGFVISQSILLFNAIKLLGAIYLIVIGWKALTAKTTTPAAAVLGTLPDPSPLRALRNGFLCNILNPKATVFFLALFSQIIDPHTPLATQLFYGLYTSVQTFTWFGFLALVISLPAIKRLFKRVQNHVERVMGAILILLGIRIALARN